MITVSNVNNQVPVMVCELPQGTVFTTHLGVAYILGKEVTSRMPLPEALQNHRHRTALTGEYAGSQSMISNDAVVTVFNCKLEIAHEV